MFASLCKFSIINIQNTKQNPKTRILFTDIYFHARFQVRGLWPEDAKGSPEAFSFLTGNQAQGAGNAALGPRTRPAPQRLPVPSSRPNTGNFGECTRRGDCKPGSPRALGLLHGLSTPPASGAAGEFAPLFSCTLISWGPHWLCLTHSPAPSGRGDEGVPRPPYYRLAASKVELVTSERPGQ